MTSRDPRTPGHVIHVGWPKTASTALQAWFAAHPEIAYHDGGIAGFGTVYDIAKHAALGEHPRVRVTSAESLSAPTRYVGRIQHRLAEDWAVDPAARLRACETLAELFPTARILIVTRGFAGSWRSGYSQYVRTGGTRPYDPAGGDVSRTVLADQWDYDRVVREYRAAFDGRVLVLPFELLRDDEAQFFSILQEELGLTRPGPPLPRVNQSLTDAELQWYPRLTRLVERVPLRGRLRDKVLDAWVRRVFTNGFARPVAALQRLRPAPPVSREVAPEVIDALRGRADVLRDDPRYAPYAADYLF